MIGEIKRLNVLDTPVDAVDMSKALSFVEDYVRNGNTPGYILAVNPEKVFILRTNPFMREFFGKASLLIPDGIGVVKALRFLYGARVSRVPGADLMQNICAESVEKNYRLFLYGAGDEVNREACEILKQRHPGINIVGRADGYVKDMKALVENINRSNAQILFVALGSPRQEEWIHEHLHELKTVRLCQGIGGTLDTITGKVARAPIFWQNLGLEWFYRLLKQPSRWKRQLKLLKFILEVILYKFGVNRLRPKASENSSTPLSGKVNS